MNAYARVRFVLLRVATVLPAVVLAACATQTPASSAPPTSPVVSGEPAPTTVPASLGFIEGNWQSIDPVNQWQMTATWNGAAARFEGVLTRNGQLSADVGFTEGELVWRAVPQPDGTVREEQMFRHGGGGVSQGAEWRIGAVDLAQSTPERMVTSHSTFVRVP